MQQPRHNATVVLICGDSEVGRWALPTCEAPDLRIVDRLARLQLELRRRGYRIRVEHACERLASLIEFAGLRDVLT